MPSTSCGSKIMEVLHTFHSLLTSTTSHSILRHSPVMKCHVITEINVGISLLSGDKRYLDLFTSYCGQIYLGNLHIASFVHLLFDSLIASCVCLGLNVYSDVPIFGNSSRIVKMAPILNTCRLCMCTVTYQ